MSTTLNAIDPSIVALSSETLETSPVAAAVAEGLRASPKWLPAWLFYDAEGSRLFERITVLPEYYPTRTERLVFNSHADAIIDTAFAAYQQATGTLSGRSLRMLELGAGSASKTGILLAAAARRQGHTEYLPIDVSATAIEEACSSIQQTLKDVAIRPQIANYVTDALDIPPHDGPTLALYIGSSIGNFSPDEAVSILQNLRAQMVPGDTLLLGTDLVKDPAILRSAYDDADGVTAAFNLNLLRRLNRELGAEFDLAAFRHHAEWNAAASRVEMHLCSVRPQTVPIPALGLTLSFEAGETIHTENSYKFTSERIDALMRSAGFRIAQTWTDPQAWFAVTVASVA